MTESWFEIEISVNRLIYTVIYSAGTLCSVN